jgi:hypothetical protein
MQPSAVWGSIFWGTVVVMLDLLIFNRLILSSDSGYHEGVWVLCWDADLFVWLCFIGECVKSSNGMGRAFLELSRDILPRWRYS